MTGGAQVRHAWYAALLLAGLLAAVRPPAALAVEIDGVQPAALDQPRVNVCVRRDPRGRPLAANVGGEQTTNVQAFLDTGASGVLISRTTAEALGIRRATAGDKDVVFHDVGVGGTEAFGVSEPLFLALGTYGGPGGEDPADYPVSLGPVRAQIGKGGGLIEMLTGGLDVVGMPAMKGRIVVLDPRPVDSFGSTMLATLLDGRKDRRSVPKTDRHVMLSYASFAAFTRTEPAGAQGPALADNPFIGPSPVAPAKRLATTRPGAKPPAAAAPAVPPVVVTHNGKRSAGSWLFDTGAAASMISKAQAGRLGVTYAPGTEGTGDPKLAGVPDAAQFTLAVGGVGGQKKAAGFFLDSLTLPTRERDPVVYKRAPVLVLDITVTEVATGRPVTLDGVLGMNFFVASADIRQAGLLPSVENLTVGPYEHVVFDEPAAALGLKLKPAFLKAGAAAPAGKRGTVEITPRRKPPQ